MTNAMELIARTMAARESQGLHIHWRLLTCAVWSAYARDADQRARLIAAKVREGWKHLPELDGVAEAYSAAREAG